MCKVWFRLVQKCEFVYGTNKHTNKQTFIFIYKICGMGEHELDLCGSGWVPVMSYLKNGMA